MDDLNTNLKANTPEIVNSLLVTHTIDLYHNFGLVGLNLCISSLLDYNINSKMQNK